MRLLIAVVAGMLVLAGCAGSPTTSGPPSNGVDVMFLQMLIPHHQQGIELVRLARDHPVRPAIRELAAAIETTQQTEIDQMKRLLHDWNQPEAMNPDPAAHASHGGMQMTDPDLVGALKSASDKEFERKFVDVLTGHQHGAVELAQNENSSNGGINADARDLARRVIESRTGEIQQLLNVTT